MCIYSGSVVIESSSTKLTSSSKNACPRRHSNGVHIDQNTLERREGRVAGRGGWVAGGGGSGRCCELSLSPLAMLFEVCQQCV